MLLTNTTDHNIIFNMDSGGSVKGHQSRTPIQANSSAVMSPIQVFMLVLNGYFQAAVDSGEIELDYDFNDFITYFFTWALIRGFL